jgi:hypothetical protein
MQGNYNYTPETNHVSNVYSVAAVLYLHFVLHVLLFCILNNFLLLHQYFPKYVCSDPYGFFYCSSLISCYPGMLLRYFLSDFEMVLLVVLAFNGFAFDCVFHIR